MHNKAEMLWGRVVLSNFKDLRNTLKLFKDLRNTLKLTVCYTFAGKRSIQSRISEVAVSRFSLKVIVFLLTVSAGKLF